MQRRSLRSNIKKDESRIDDKGFEEEDEYQDEEGASNNNEDEDDGSSTSSEEVEPPPLMVLNRSRRANAGNLMQKLLTEKEIEKKEGDEVYENLWGGFLDVENDHNFEVTAADFQSADEDSNSELDEQETGEEDEGADEEGNIETIDGEPRRKKKKHSSWLLTKMSETTVNENKLSEVEQKSRMKECLKVAARNRQSLEALKQKQLEEQQKHAKKARARHLDGPKEAWYSDKHVTYLLLPEIKQWLPPKIPKKREESTS